MKKVHLDFGHGGKDGGAVGNGMKEKDINLLVGLKVGEILEDNNIKVSYSRKDDTFIELSERATMSNKLNVDAFISIHTNAHSDINVKGIETFSYPNSKKGSELSKCIQDSLLKDKVYTRNRGLKTANFAVLRKTTAPATLTELGFITNVEDAKILKNKQNELSLAIAKGILNFLGLKYEGGKPKLGFNILSNTNTTIEQMKEWARSKKANQEFIDLAPVYYEISKKVGVNPLITYTQSAKETGFFNFGGVIDITYKNPCGMKISAGGGNYNPEAHMKFKSWEEGIQAQVDHLALYAGAKGYPRAASPDPRHFPYIKGTSTTVEELGGKWAPSPNYGIDIVKMIMELESTKITIKPKGERTLIDVKLTLHGKSKIVKGIKENDQNYVPVRLLEDLGYVVKWNQKTNTVEVEYNK